MKKSSKRQRYRIILVALFFFTGFYQVKAQSEGFPPNSSVIINAINVKDSDIRDILRAIALEYETNISVGNDVNKKVSVSLFNLKVFDAVKIIATDNDLEFSYNTFRFQISNKRKIDPPLPPDIKPVIQFKQGRLSAEIINAELSEIIDSLRVKTKKNYLITPGTNGKLTGSLTNIDLETGLKNLFANNGFYLTKKDSIYYISRSSHFSSLEANDQSHKPYWVSAQGSLISLDVTEADLSRVLSDLSNQMGLQIIMLKEPKANVTVRCSDVSINSALSYLFKGTEFSYKKDGSVYVIGSKDNKMLDEIKLVYLNYLRADQMKDKIPSSLMQNLNMTVSVEHNALLFTGPIENLSSVEEFIEKIDQPVAQVLIEALVVDYNIDDMSSFGISAGLGDSVSLYRADKWFPGIDVTASGKRINKLLGDIGIKTIFGKNVDIGKLGKLPDNFYLNIRALEQNGLANIKSKPVLSTLNGHTASLKIGTVQNYIFKEIVPIVNAVNSTFIEKERIEKVEAIISFEITPWVGNNGELTLEIKPNFETPVGSFSPDKEMIPAINTRSFLSTVRLRDGETIVLGGVVQESEILREDKFPILGDIPLLGKLFTSTEKSTKKGELMIYLTPRIYYGEDLVSLKKK